MEEERTRRKDLSRQIGSRYPSAIGSAGVAHSLTSGGGVHKEDNLSHQILDQITDSHRIYKSHVGIHPVNRRREVPTGIGISTIGKLKFSRS